MYIIFVLLVVLYCAASAVFGRRLAKKLEGVPVSHTTRTKLYIRKYIWNGVPVLAVLAIGMFAADIGFGELGFRPIYFAYNHWFTAITLIFSGALLALSVYQGFGSLVSERVRDKSAAELAEAIADGKMGIIEETSVPISKKEKVMYFGLGLAESLNFGAVVLGLLLFSLQSLLPDTPVVFVVLAASLIAGIAGMYNGLSGTLTVAAVSGLLVCLFLVTGSVIPSVILFFLFGLVSVFSFTEENEHMFEDYKNFNEEAKRYARLEAIGKTLQKSELPDIADEDLHIVVSSWIEGKMNFDFDEKKREESGTCAYWSHELAIIAALPKPCQNFHFCDSMLANVNSGGFHDMFAEQMMELVKLSIEGFIAIGYPKLAEIVQKAISRYEENKEALDEYYFGEWDLEDGQPFPAEAEMFDDLDTSFQDESRQADLTAYIKAHIDAFGDESTPT